MTGAGPKRSKLQLEDLLLRHGSVTEAQLEAAREDQRAFGGELGRILVEHGAVSEELLLRAIAHQRGIEMVDPECLEIDADAIAAVPVQVCERYSVIPIEVDRAARTVRLAAADPANVLMLAEIEDLIGLRPVAAAALGASVDAAIRRHYYGEERAKPLSRIKLQKAAIRRPIGGVPATVPPQPLLAASLGVYRSRALQPEPDPGTGGETDEGLELPEEQAPESGTDDRLLDLQLGPSAQVSEGHGEPIRSIPRSRPRLDPARARALFDSRLGKKRSSAGGRRTSSAGRFVQDPSARHVQTEEEQGAPLEPIPEEELLEAEPISPEVAELSDIIVGLEERIAQLEDSPSQHQFAAALARIEQLEQIATQMAQVLRVVGGVLVDSDLISLDDYRQRTKQE